MKKPIVIALHLLFWLPKLIIAILTTKFFVQAASQTDHTSIMAFTASAGFIASITSFYLFYSYLFSSFLAKKRIASFILYGLIIWIILSVSLLGIGYLWIPNIMIGPANLVVLFYPSIYSILFSGILGGLFKGFVTWYSEIRVKEQLVQKNLQSELALLKAQINPHFLFNTINNIDVLIQKDAAAASKYLNQLSDMMRFMLYETSSELIPLSKELEYIKKYIELQKIRTSNEKYVNLAISGEEDGVMVAPALFIPFIENAFKHSTNKKIENAIKIVLEIEKNAVTFCCLNYFEHSESFRQTSSGLGIELIKQRLHLLYPEKHQLEIVTRENQYEVKLTLKTA